MALSFKNKKTVVKGTLTATWAGDVRSMPYIRQGNIVMIEAINVQNSSGSADTPVVTVDAHLRPTATRTNVVHEDSEVIGDVVFSVATNGEITIAGSVDYNLSGYITYFI